MANQVEMKKMFQKGLKHHLAGQISEAEKVYTALLKIAPRYADALCNLGVIRKGQGKTDEALKLYERALVGDPNNADYLNNQGALLQNLGRTRESIQALEKAVKLKPGHVDSWVNLSYSYFLVGNLTAAEAAGRKAVELRPQAFEGWNNLGNALYPQGLIDEALTTFRRALELNPNFATATSNRLFVINNHPDLSMDEIFQEYKTWGEKLEARFPNERFADIPRVNKRLRIGYLSPDFRNHSMRYFLLPLIEQHDKQNFEVVLYADQWVSDETTTKYKQAVEQYHEVKPLSDAELCKRIRGDRIDILVDLAGHTAGNRLNVFAMRAAPVQVSYLGYGYTTGLSRMDYFIADDLFLPPDGDRYFSEKVMRLPRPQYVFRPDERPDVGGLPALRKGYVTFGCFSRSIRLNYKVIRCWAAILKRVPSSRLLLNTRYLTDVDVQARFLARFADHGVTAERIEFKYESPPWRSYTEEVDIALDPFPHNAGATTFDALWMGCPVVSLAAHPAIGRFGAAILTPLGLPDWVAKSEEAYIEFAAAKAGDLPGLEQLRKELRQRYRNSPFCDEASLARAMENAYRAMWANAASQQKAS